MSRKTLLLVLLACAGPATAEHALERLTLEAPKVALERGAALLRGEPPPALRERLEILDVMGRAATQLGDDVALAEVLLRLQGEQGPAAAALVHQLRASRLRSRDRHEDALAEALAGAALLEEGEPHWRAQADYVLCSSYVDNRRFDAAERHCLRAEAAWRELGDEYHLARVENVLSFIPYYQGKLDAAIPVSERAYRRAGRIGAVGLAALVGANLSQAYLDAGRHEEALSLSRETLASELRSGRVGHAADTRVNIARALHAMGQSNEALAELARGIAEAESVDHRLVLHELQEARALIAEEAGQLELALDAARQLAQLRQRPLDRATPDVVAELEARYQAREQALRIRALEQERRGDLLRLAEVELASARQRGLLWGVALAAATALGLVLLLGWLLRTQRRLAQQLQHLSERDPLTGVENRRAFMQRLERIFTQDKRERRALLILDLDHFKSINDQYGHPFGDTVLLATVAAVSEELDAGCRFARLGGEEFAVLAEQHDAASAADLAERMRAAVAAMRIGSPRGEVTLGVSIGCAPLSPEIEQPGAWLRAADAALYRAKHAGRNRVVMHAADAAA